MRHGDCFIRGGAGIGFYDAPDFQRGRVVAPDDLPDDGGHFFLDDICTGKRSGLAAVSIPRSCCGGFRCCFAAACGSVGATQSGHSSCGASTRDPGQACAIRSCAGSDSSEVPNKSRGRDLGGLGRLLLRFRYAVVFTCCGIIFMPIRA
jgi:hypothetical protein